VVSWFVNISENLGIPILKGVWPNSSLALVLNSSRSQKIGNKKWNSQLPHGPELYTGVSESFWTESITKYKLTFGITCWEATQRVMVAKLARLTHKIAIQLHLVAESCTICSSPSRQPVWELLDTPLYTDGRTMFSYLALNMEAARFSETSVNHPTTSGIIQNPNQDCSQTAMKASRIL
jgi:hypothetical protein